MLAKLGKSKTFYTPLGRVKFDVVGSKIQHNLVVLNM